MTPPLHASSRVTVAACSAALFVLHLGGKPVAAATSGAPGAAGFERPEQGACAAGAAVGGLCAAEQAGAEDAALGLLQRRSRHQLAERGRAPAQEAPAEAWPYTDKVPPVSIFPLAWFHVPKCGSSFLNALLRVPGACHGIPEDLEVTNAHFGFDNIAGLWNAYPPAEHCPGSFSRYGDHAGFGLDGSPSYELLWKGHAVTILRQPEQRILSAWYNYNHSWPVHELGPPPGDVLEFAHVLKGCLVRMLTRGGENYVVDRDDWMFLGPHWGGPCGGPEPPTPQELVLAKKRLREAFLFVGIQEEWQLSMCLFHAIFGGACNSAEFLDSRHVEHLPAIRYDRDLLEGFRDEYDHELFTEAKQMFKDSLRAYNLSVAACQPCFKQANITYPE